jgi:hypothetical protein
MKCDNSEYLAVVIVSPSSENQNLYCYTPSYKNSTHITYEAVTVETTSGAYKGAPLSDG